jgi:hypothetical protein
VPVCIRPVVRHNGINIAIVPGLDASQCPEPVQADLVASPTAVKADPARDYMMGARISALSRMLGAGLVLCAGGMGESTYHGIYKNLGGIFENGAALGFQYDYEPLVLVRDIDLDLLPIKQTPAVTDLGGENLTRQRLNRHIAKNPLLPEGNRERILDDMADTQIHGLATRMKPTHLKKMVIGVSGGIDSTHALLVCAAVCDRLGMERSDIIAVLMPGFGTKADMWRTIGVPEWRVDLLRPDAAERAVETVGDILSNPAEAAAKAVKVKEFLDKSTGEMFAKAFGGKILSPMPILP